MSVERNTREQLAMLREMTASTGALHEAQVTQLRNWPALLVKWPYEVAINAGKKFVEVRYSPGRLSMRPRGFDAGCANMAGWLKTLLGPRWCLKVTIRGKEHAYFGPEQDDGFSFGREAAKRDLGVAVKEAQQRRGGGALDELEKKLRDE